MSTFAKTAKKRDSFPVKNFLYLMRGRTATKDSVRTVLRAMAAYGQIPEVPYFTMVRVSKTEGKTVPGVYLDLGYSESVDEQTLVIHFDIDCDGDCTGMIGRE